jgi:hypothetical protein
LQQHLRHIKVRMPIQMLDVSSGNNPFILTHLPLDILHIDFEEIKDVGDWLKEAYVYQRFISALLYQSLPKNGGSQGGVLLHKSLVQKFKRFVAGVLLQKWATQRHLYHLLFNMKTKKLLVECASSSKDILWSAFTHFSLVDDILSMFYRAADRKLHYIMFADEDDQSFMEMGQWPVCP